MTSGRTPLEQASHTVRGRRTAEWGQASTYARASRGVGPDAASLASKWGREGQKRGRPDREAGQEDEHLLGVQFPPYRVEFLLDPSRPVVSWIRRASSGSTRFAAVRASSARRRAAASSPPFDRKINARISNAFSCARFAATRSSYRSRRIGPPGSGRSIILTSLPDIRPHGTLSSVAFRASRGRGGALPGRPRSNSHRVSHSCCSCGSHSYRPP